MAGVEGVPFWKLRPRNKVVVFYNDDTVWHESHVLLFGGSPESYWIVTPDEDIYEEDLRGGSDDGPRRVRHAFGVKSLPHLRVAVPSDEIFRRWIKVAIEEHRRAYGDEPDLAQVRVECADGNLSPLVEFAGIRRRLRQGSCWSGLSPRHEPALFGEL